MKKRSASYVEKIFYARGYHDCLIGESSEPPSFEVNQYYIELCNVNVVDEYNKGFAQGQKDKVNGIV